MRKLIFLPLLALLALCPARASAQTFVQGNACDQVVAGTTVACAFAANLGAARLMVVSASWDQAAATASLSDTLAHTFTSAVGPIVNATCGCRGQIWYVPSTSAGADTVTLTTSAATAFRDIEIHEYSGMNTAAPLDQTCSATGNDAAPTCTTAATTQAAELVFGMTFVSSGTPSAGAGYTQRTQAIDTLTTAEDKNVAATGAQTVNFTDTLVAQWGDLGATFKAAGGAAPAPKRLPVLGVGAMVEWSGVTLPDLLAIPTCGEDPGCTPGLRLCNDDGSAKLVPSGAEGLTTGNHCIELARGENLLQLALVLRRADGSVAHPAGTVKLTLPPASANLQ